MTETKISKIDENSFERLWNSIVGHPPESQSEKEAFHNIHQNLENIALDAVKACVVRSAKGALYEPGDFAKEGELIGDGNVCNQGSWRKLVKDLGHKDACLEVARKLKVFAEHMEKLSENGGEWPQVYSCAFTPGRLLEKSFIERISVTLSNPWPG